MAIYEVEIKVVSHVKIFVEADNEEDAHETTECNLNITAAEELAFKEGAKYTEIYEINKVPENKIKWYLTKDCSTIGTNIPKINSKIFI